MLKKKSINRPVYWIEEENNRFYVYYWKSNQGIVKTLFDVKYSQKEAKQSIKEHKQGKHSTQWKPE